MVAPSKNRLRFVDSNYESRGRISKQLYTPSGVKKIFVEIDIIDADVTKLMGMNVMDKISLTPCIVSNRLIKRPIRKNSRGKIVDWLRKMIA